MVLDTKDQVESELSGEEVINQIHQNILERYPREDFTFAEPILCEVADDGDLHDWGFNRKGFLSFTRASIVNIGARSFVVSKSDRTVGYPADNMGNELKIFEILEDHENLANWIAIQIHQAKYHKNSVITSLTNGSLILNETKTSILLRQKVLEIKDEAESHMRTTHSEVFFQPEVVDIISEAIYRSLEGEE